MVTKKTKETKQLGVPVKRTRKVKAPEYTKPLKLGDQGAVVEYMVHALIRHGSRMNPGDRFHIGMRSAVICFQKKNQLKPTGVIDKKTWEKLIK